MSSSRLKNWKIMPILARRYFARPVSVSSSTRTPSTVTLPDVGLSSPAIMFSRVDLPLPDGPRTASASPARTSRVSPSRAAPRASYVFVTSRISITTAPHRRYVHDANDGARAGASAAVPNSRRPRGGPPGRVIRAM